MHLPGELSKFDILSPGPNRLLRLLSVLCISMPSPSGFSDLLQARSCARMYSVTLLVLLTCAAIPLDQSNEVALGVHFY